MAVKLILADSDEAYVEDMARYIRVSEWRHKLSASVFTDLRMAEDLRDGNPNAILLVAEDFAAAAGRRASGLQILLAEEHENTVHSDLPKVDKYQPADSLLQQVMTLYYEQNGAPPPVPPVPGRSARIVAVYGASGGSGTTTTSLRLARHLADLEYKVFYLNMEGVSSFPVSDAEEGEESFARVLYTLRGGHHFSARTGRLIHHDERWRSDMFRPARHPGEWAEYGMDDVKQLLQAIGKDGEYDYVVVDLDGCLTDAALGAIVCCTDLLWVTSGHEIGRVKERNAMHALRLLLPDLWEVISHKMKYTAPPDVGRQQDDGLDDGKDGIAAIAALVIPETDGEVNDRESDIH